MRRAGEAGHSLVALGAELDGFGARLRAEGFDWRDVAVPIRGMDPLGGLRLFLAFWGQFRRLRPWVAHMFTIKPAIYGTLAAALVGPAGLE